MFKLKAILRAACFLSFSLYPCTRQTSPLSASLTRGCIQAGVCSRRTDAPLDQDEKLSEDG